MNAWEAVFSQSRVNDGYYAEAELPQNPWQWPAETWLKARLELVRRQEGTAFLRSLKKFKARNAPELN